MQLTIDQYNEIYGTDIKEFTQIEFTDYIAFLMEQVKLNSSDTDNFINFKN
jgi:hypothetical protein